LDAVVAFYPVESRRRLFFACAELRSRIDLNRKKQAPLVLFEGGRKVCYAMLTSGHGLPFLQDLCGPHQRHLVSSERMRQFGA